MDFSVEEIEPNVWRVRIASVTRIVRYRGDSMTFAPWDVTGTDGHVLWSAESLDSAFRWIQARTGYPAEGLLAQALLQGSAGAEPTAAQTPDEPAGSAESREALGR